MISFYLFDVTMRHVEKKYERISIFPRKNILFAFRSDCWMKKKVENEKIFLVGR